MKLWVFNEDKEYGNSKSKHTSVYYKPFTPSVCIPYIKMRTVETFKILSTNSTLVVVPCIFKHLTLNISEYLFIINYVGFLCLF